MDLQALFARARALAVASGDGVDAFVKDALAFFAQVPEPPLYRRRDDPARARAAELLPQVERLLARGWALGAPVAAFTAALEGHAEALGLLAEGRVEAAEPAWQAAMAREREATAALRLWTRTDTGRPPVYERESGRSRFDPRPDGQVELRLACPHCRKVTQVSVSPRVATNHFTCPSCAGRFTAYLAELRVLELERVGRSHKRYRFRVEELGGTQTRVEFEDASPGDFTGARRDLLAFLYAPETRLRGVLNLESSRVLWLPGPGPCFVATVAFGEGARELTVLRAFRDERLRATAAGRRFVAWYYRAGPALARVVARTPGARAVSRAALRGVVRLLERTR